MVISHESTREIWGFHYGLLSKPFERRCNMGYKVEEQMKIRDLTK
jgi:hypothetical protein